MTNFIRWFASVVLPGARRVRVTEIHETLEDGTETDGVRLEDMDAKPAGHYEITDVSDTPTWTLDRDST